ncbi:hypothetical protein [Lactiplantibacillus plantarum]|uniref:hypothetical protein n=1 Tax=Lactiplantibacillus plantarum TaxID=1590 RepID=UPI000977BA5C|nr:hypothetical protein [Lactiplantibacillus plantarum]
MENIDDLTEEDKMVLAQQIVASYSENRINDKVLAIVEELMGHTLEGEVQDNYNDLLDVYHRLGGGTGVINNTTVNLDVEALTQCEQLKDTWAIAKYILRRYGREVRVRRLKFDTYKLF